MAVADAAPDFTSLHPGYAGSIRATLALDCFVEFIIGPAKPDPLARNDERATFAISQVVMAGLDPAIHALMFSRKGRRGSPGQAR